MPQSTPNPESGETRKSRLELLRDRVGKDTEAPESVTPSPSTTPSVNPPVAPQPIQQETQQLPAIPYPQRGLGQPSVHDRRSKVPFDVRYKKENFMIDKRLLPYVYDWLETHGISKVDAVNRAWLKILLSDGYPIDPNILDRVFKYEDLPK